MLLASPKIDRDTMTMLSDEAAKDAFRSNLFPAIKKLTELTRAELAGARSEGTSATSNRNSPTVPVDSSESKPAPAIWPWIVGAGVVGIAGYQISKASGAKKAKETAVKYRENAIQAISFIDAYDRYDMAMETQNIKELRNSSYDFYEIGKRRFENSRTHSEYKVALQDFENSLKDSKLAIAKIKEVTGEGAMAFKPLHSIAEIDTKRAPMFEKTAGACFFTGEPDQGQLMPVEMVIDGKNRTVMACPAAMAELREGRMPQMAGSMNGTRAVPWYNSNANGGPDLGFFSMMAMMSYMHPYGGNTSVHNNYGGTNNSSWDNSDSSSSRDSSSGGGDFNFGSSGSDSSSSGGGDFGSGGGGDSGGGDF